jgi:glycosyltransferase involved in cell wall biosynthesis
MVSIIIPARNEIYLEKTIRSVLSAARGEIEVLAMLDGYIPSPQIISFKGDGRVKFFHENKSIGQRQSINKAAKVAKGKFIMKLDAHCALDKGFDVKLAADCEYDWTVVPSMERLDIETWKPRRRGITNYMYISSPTAEKPFRAQYYEGRKKDGGQRQPKNDKLIDDTMCCMGPCFFMHKKRFWELGGCDEDHGSWGQQGIEVALKAWLSGGSLKVNKKTWFAHYFRVGSTGGFPWPASGRKQEEARKYSRDLWLNNKWPLQKRKLQWLVDKFNPPGWDKMSDLTILYYTANVISPKIEAPVVRSLKKHGYPIISISQKPMDLGTNILFKEERSIQNIYRQVLLGAQRATTEYVALCEDDSLYTKEHFTASRPKTFAYNLNRWVLHLSDNIFTYRKRPVLSQCIAHRETLIKNLEERFRIHGVNVPSPICGEMGYFDKRLGMTEHGYETFETKKPNMVVHHDKAITKGRLQGKDKPPTQNIPGWGNSDYWVKKFGLILPANRGQEIKLRRQHSHIANVTLDVEQMCINRLDYVEPGKGISLRRFVGVFPPFIKYVAENEDVVLKITKWLPADKLKSFEYYDYLVSKLNPADKDPLTPKGSRHCLALMRDAAKLYIDIKKFGLRNPLDIYKYKNRFALHRGGRRLEILRGLGYKKVPCRVFESKKMFQQLCPEKNIVIDNSIHSLGMKQFQEFGDLSTDKYWVHGYTRLYDAHIGYLRPTAKRILELGVLRGASLLLWKDAFPKAHIYGVDIKQRSDIMFKMNDSRITFLLGNQQDQKFLKNQVTNCRTGFDIIIDDASHRGDKMIESFNVLWNILKPGGWYILEDLYGHYRKGRKSMMPFIYGLVDQMNIKCTIQSMHFYYNIVFIQKG